MLNRVYRSIDALIGYACACLDLDPSDVDWARNQILALFSLDSYDSGDGSADPASGGVDDLLESFIRALVGTGLMAQDDAPSMADTVMGILSSRPSHLQRRFAQVERARGGTAAMHWFYDYCVRNTYIKKSRLDRNPRFSSGGVVVTINLAKPEFKDMKKAAAGNSTAGGYPKCTICHENEGFAGRDKRTLRTIPLTLGGHDWFWQFSPYGYFREHGICVNAAHTPMHVDKDSFGNLLDFVDRFPGYFLGCNAALPRIGGSVLAHDHYQGGGQRLPMHQAGAWRTLHLDGHPDTPIEILDWPGTVVRVVSPSRQEIIEVSETIRQAWVDYDNPDLNITSQGPEGRQSALSPSLVKTDRGYEMSLILRNNGVSPEFPDGIFHVHPEFYPVKQEPIGLIEAQGLFVLPGRLVGQLACLEKALVAGTGLPEQVADFSLEYGEITKTLQGSHDPDQVHEALKSEIGSVCARILGNTAVFKRPEQTEGFLRGLGCR
ncbi:UDP-glucose--hexose-1-phosphate uridylyltransferase [Bifidobacterium sp. H6bp9]|uniref:UDP-glucose--hexose-1-phosphate uridylyltransferase n=1 Tax=Bifidobacterium sp. H6bp9 TaxID=3051961 RepID=UPI0028BE86FB|nr:UDP-glucose--hexose-1-phosphate uridylyltransferase [Bifidobacterium sp. H6bp9]MDT7510767.1 UDP-glucose--hexose-1-phosphate uridylyltransferase [Bifidobacterium sp. H6bp9]